MTAPADLHDPAPPSADTAPVLVDDVAAEVRISPLRYFDVRRSGASVSVRCTRCNQRIGQPGRSALLDLIVLDALGHECQAAGRAR